MIPGMAATPPRPRPTYAEAARTLLRDTLLDAAGDLMRERGWGEVTMAGVAAAAGVSRQTLYHTFGSRSEVAQAYVLREADRFVSSVEAALRAHAADPRRALVAALEVFLSDAEGHPLIRAMVSGGEGDELLALVTTRGGPVLGLAAARLAAVLSAIWSDVDAASVELVADCIVRLAISHATLPGAPPETTAAALGEVLGPYLESVVAAASG
jgi:AcrR family transcriptional regulator